MRLRRRPRRIPDFSEISSLWAEPWLTSDQDAGSLERPIQPRTTIFFLLIALGFIFLTLRLSQLTLAEGAHQRSLAEGNRLRAESLLAPRGVIADRSGAILARNLPDYRLVAVPANLPTGGALASLWQKAGALTGQPSGRLSAAAEVPAADRYQAVTLAAHLTSDQALAVEGDYSELPGLSIQTSPVRDYPYGALYAHLIGYTAAPSQAQAAKLDPSRYQSSDPIGETGLEESYEDQLHGTDGATQTEVDANGRPITTLRDVRATPGSSLALSVDSQLQRQMQTSLQAMLDHTSATGAVAVALNPKTGEVLGYVSLPSFDPNQFSQGISTSAYHALLDNPEHPLLDRVIAGTYPPGSTIKPFVASVALADGTVTPETTINGPAKITVGGQDFPDWRTQGPGINLQKAIAVSSDVYFYGVGGGYSIPGVGSIQGLGINRLASGLRKFAFGEPTGIDLDGEISGIIPDPAWKERTKSEQWYLGDTYHASIGQGDLSVTPLQLVTSLAALANGGTIYQPHLVTKITSATGKSQTIGPRVLAHQVFPAGVLQTVREGMRQTVTSGTARPLQDLPVEVAGKTGTAEYGADNNHSHAWFEAFGPYTDPTIALVVMIEGGGEGFDAAEPVANEILKAYLSS